MKFFCPYYKGTLAVSYLGGRFSEVTAGICWDRSIVQRGLRCLDIKALRCVCPEMASVRTLNLHPLEKQIL